MAVIIALGTADAQSADFTLLDGASTTLALINDGSGPLDGAAAIVQVKSGALYFPVGSLTFANPAQLLAAPGTFRVIRRNAAVTFGVDRV